MSMMELSHVEVRVVARRLYDPLNPLPAVNLSKTAKALYLRMKEILTELKQQWEEASTLAGHLAGVRVVGNRRRHEMCARLLRQHWLTITRSSDDRLAICRSDDMTALTISQWRTFANLARYHALPRLGVIRIWDCDDEKMTTFVLGLSCGSMASLWRLEINKPIGLETASGLAAALIARAVPSLHTLDLMNGHNGDSVITVLAPALRQLTHLKWLQLGSNDISDLGLANLLAELSASLLQQLNVSYNRITDDGCDAFASALSDGALPDLYDFSLYRNPASDQGKKKAEAIPRARMLAWPASPAESESDP